MIEWTEAGKAPRQFQIVELRSKPLTDDGTFDLYAVELTPGMASKLPRKPVVHGVGEFDMVQAYRAARALIENIFSRRTRLTGVQRHRWPLIRILAKPSSKR